jgi:hypothetical protein
MSVGMLQGSMQLVALVFIIAIAPAAAEAGF